LAICKRGQGVELRITENNTRYVLVRLTNRFHVAMRLSSNLLRSKLFIQLIELIRVYI